MLQQKPLIVKLVQVSALQFLTTEFIVTDKWTVSNVNCQARLSEISHRHHHANPAFSTNMLGHTAVDW